MVSYENAKLTAKSCFFFQNSTRDQGVNFRNLPTSRLEHT